MLLSYKWIRILLKQCDGLIVLVIYIKIKKIYLDYI